MIRVYQQIIQNSLHLSLITLKIIKWQIQKSPLITMDQ
jgi:hypothetical protein